MVEEAFLNSPIGRCRLTASDQGLRSIDFLDEEGEQTTAEQAAQPSFPHLLRALEQLDAYFSGKLTTFTCTLAPQGTEFQKRVWKRLSEIPFGVTKSYGQIASEISQPRASRAVGGANNKNPLPIIVPCHRVVGANNALVGFGCGLWRKQWMLKHEGIALPLA